MRPSKSVPAVLATAALVVLGSAAPALASTTVRDPGAPGCSVDVILADHTTGGVAWSISCDAGRWVVVDSTAFAGTPEDHEVVETQQLRRWVDAGSTWTGTQLFGTLGVDQIRTQAVTFVTEDPFELPAVIGGATG